MRSFTKWIGVFYILNFLDYMSTIMAVSQGAVEVNLFANFFLSNGLLLHYKFIGLCILTLILYRIAKRNLRSMNISLILIKFGCILYSLVVLNNSYVYLVQTFQFL